MSPGTRSWSPRASAALRLTTRQSVRTFSGAPTPVSTRTAPLGCMTTKPWTGQSRPSTPVRLARCKRLISSTCRLRQDADGEEDEQRREVKGRVPIEAAGPALAEQVECSQRDQPQTEHHSAGQVHNT